MYVHVSTQKLCKTMFSRSETHVSFLSRCKLARPHVKLHYPLQINTEIVYNQAYASLIINPVDYAYIHMVYVYVSIHTYTCTYTHT
jgi:hypothetical protein